MAVELKASIATLYRNLQRAAQQGVVPRSAFEAETAALGLDDTARARLASALLELGLRLEAPTTTVTPIDDSGEVKKVAGSRTEKPQPEDRMQPRVGAALRLLDRYAAERAVPERAVAGVARLAGLTASETADMRARAAARFTLLLAEPEAARTPAPETPGMAEPASEASAPPAPAAAVEGAAPFTGGLTAAVAAARAVIEEDRHTKRPEKRILTALEEVGLSVLLRGGPRNISVEPTDEELGSLPATDVRRRARDCLAAHNQGLAWAQARAHMGQGLDEDDLFQHGMIGVLRAARKFDPGHGNKFSTYATWWVRQSITRALADEGSAIRIPVHMHELVRKVGRVERELLSAGKSRSAAAVAVACDLPVGKVEEIRRISKVTDSTDRIIGDGTHLGELLEVRTALPSVEVAVLASLADEGVHDLVALLPERYARIVALRVGLDGTAPATLDAIGGELGVTRERVRQLESQVFSVLRIALRDPAGNPYAALSEMLTEAGDDGATNNPVGAISRDLNKPDWRAGIKALTAFRAREGRAVPDRNHVEDGFPLGEWVAQQRVEGRVGGRGLPAQRRMLLETLGMVWTAPRSAEVQERIRRAYAESRALRAAGRHRLARTRTATRPAAHPVPAPASATPTPVAPASVAPETVSVEAAQEQPAGPESPTVTETETVLLPEPRTAADTSAADTVVDTSAMDTSVDTVADVIPEAEPPAVPEQRGEPADAATQSGMLEAERYTGRWDDAMGLSLTLNRSVRWTAHYIHLALGQVLLGEILGSGAARSVAEVAAGNRLPDRPVGQALEALVRVVDGLKDRKSRPEDFFESPSPALLGRSPRTYLTAHPLTKPESRLALADALKEFSLVHGSSPATADADPDTGVYGDGDSADALTATDTLSVPAATDQICASATAGPVGTPEAVTEAPATLADASNAAVGAVGSADDAALRRASAAAEEAAGRLRELEADVTDRVARARAAERNHARAEARAEVDEATRRIRALEAGLVDRIAHARAEERNRARAEARAETAQQIAGIRDEAERLVREAGHAAEERVRQVRASMEHAAAEREEQVLRRVEEEVARRTLGIEEAARQEVLALETRLRQAEAAFAERAHAAQALEQDATERVRAAERWAEQRVAEAEQAMRSHAAEVERAARSRTAEVEQAARSRIAELEARLASMHDTPVPAPPYPYPAPPQTQFQAQAQTPAPAPAPAPADPQQHDSRRWWRRG
ncbi:sigma-70 family RNA polymerase sigma factor [Streptomyces sp. NPDC057496]|uniref:sigma-70 family RNA polymerase sigma factor n=1 Tax=Streptomyces sp. NPDC057496 TaxID=3346149 RepID=UPI00367B1B5E